MPQIVSGPLLPWPSPPGAGKHASRSTGLRLTQPKAQDKPFVKFVDSQLGQFVELALPHHLDAVDHRALFHLVVIHETDRLERHPRAGEHLPTLDSPANIGFAPSQRP